MKLQAGYNALDFAVKDVFGNDIRLSDYRGSKIILSFYRNVACPFCNRRVHQVMGYNKRLEAAGVKLVFFFESTNEKLKSSIWHEGISPWPLVGDPDKKVYQLYGVEQSTLKMINTMFASSVFKARKETKDMNLPEDNEASNNLIPADFLIDEQFKVVKAYYGKHLDDHVDIEELKAFAGIESLFKKTI
jgi:peroxiredoxin